jgi:arginine decarboxylase
MSLIKLLKKKSKMIFFTTPSHAQNFFLFSKFKQFYKYDISETDFCNPQKALIEAQIKASRIYKTKATYFLTNGSTSGIIASVLACVSRGEKVLLWDNAHPSHLNAVKLAGAEPVYYELDKDEKWGIFKQISPEIIEKKLKSDKIKAVIITSPTYEGIVSDILNIKEICKKFGAFLIVDEAHGALYPFCDKLPKSALDFNADFVIQSLHKTAGGLNPTALLHCNVDADIQKALEMINTTSPSYPLLMSVEKNINFLNSKKGRAKILELVENIRQMKKNVKNCEFYQADETKILLKSKKISGFKLSEFLYNNKIEDEKTNEKSTMLLCGVGTEFKRLKKLQRILNKI